MKKKLLLGIMIIALQANGEEVKMANEKPNIPPEILAYIAGPDYKETKQFDFLIGEWRIDGKRMIPDGTKMPYEGSWEAHYLNEERMVIDNFKTYSPDGSEISSYVTLRTYSPLNKRWQFTGLAAMLPAHETHEWYGNLENNEMILNATGKTPDGKVVKNQIRFYEISKNSFKWQSKVSLDGGTNWFENSSLEAKRVEK